MGKNKDTITTRMKLKMMTATTNGNKRGSIKVILPDGLKPSLSFNHSDEEKIVIVNEILEEYRNYFNEFWYSDSVKKCLDVLAYYLCTTGNGGERDKDVLSKYKMNEMREGSRKHTTFSALSSAQKAALGLIDVPDEDE